MIYRAIKPKLRIYICFSIVFILTAIVIENPVLAPQKANYEVISSGLEKVLNNSEFTEELDVIVQMKELIDNYSLSIFNILGFRAYQKFSAINGIRLIGSKSAIHDLSNFKSVKWIEHDIKIDFYQEVSTTTINATRVWENVVLSPDGTDLGNIDGSGVTVAVVDTGIDATHPDLDYQEKTIMNLKSDFGLYGDGIWQDMPNTDNGYGHGTHCAGTIAGNGDASAGARRGVAPGANLIGLGTGDALLFNVLGGLNWVYENSRPNANPYNIRAVSNSWGPGSEEEEANDESDAIIEITRKLTWDNNVVCMFAAGNSGGDGSSRMTSRYSNNPPAIGVAAAWRDGKGMADFSSRGKQDEISTYPDVAAPGVNIWSAAARRTVIGLTNEVESPYYLAISGTSMATPHVSGAVALLFQAAPSLRMSNMSEDIGEDEDNEWVKNNITQIHEVEWILKATAKYIEPDSDNALPSENATGMYGRSLSFIQGYGVIDVEKAVSVALTLEELRKTDDTVTVQDALDSYNGVISEQDEQKRTNTLMTSWRGEWSQYLTPAPSTVFEVNQSRLVRAPENASRMILDLTYTAVDSVEFKVVDLTFAIDYDRDGSSDFTGSFSPNPNGQKHEEIEISSGEFSSHRGEYWYFTIEGQGIGRPFSQLHKEPEEVRGEYAYSVSFVFDLSDEDNEYVDVGGVHSGIGRLEFGDQWGYDGGTITITQGTFDLKNIGEEEEPEPIIIEQDLGWLIFFNIAGLFLIVMAYFYRIRYLVNNKKVQ
jgi:serine protease AprX